MCTNFAVLQMYGDNFIHNCTRHFRTLFVHFANCEMSILSNDAVHLLLQCVRDDRGSPWLLSVMNICSPIPKHCAPFSDTGHVHNMFAIDRNKSLVNFTNCKNRIAPRTSQSAGFDISAFIVTTRYTHNVKKFAAHSASGNYLHSTEHTTWLIWYNDTTVRVVGTNFFTFRTTLIFNACRCKYCEILRPDIKTNFKQAVVVEGGWWCGFVSSRAVIELASTGINLLKPNDIYICRTAALTTRCYILNIYSTNIHTEYFKHAA